MAETSRAAQQEAAAKVQEEREKAAREAAEKERLAQVHREFEVEALTAARATKLVAVVGGHEHSLGLLQAQGFVAKQLTRRPEFEAHLGELCSSRQAELVRLSERVVAACPGLEQIEGDSLLHRNPLVSLMETLWRRRELKEPFDLELVLAYARTQSSASPQDLERIKAQIGQALCAFGEVKAAESKFQRVRWENLTIPPGEQKATYVSWEASEHGGGLVEAFSAQRLKWLATLWPDLAAYLGELIESVAVEGQQELQLFAWRATDGWLVADAWPAYLAADDGRLESSLNATALEDETDDGWPFCNPALAACELEAAGYTVAIEPKSIGQSEQLGSNHSGAGGSSRTPHQACRLSIRWG